MDVQDQAAQLGLSGLDVAAVGLDDVTTDRQAQPGTAEAPAT